MKIGCSLPAMTFMPEYKKKEKDMPPMEGLVYGYNTATQIGYDYIEAAVGVVMQLSEDEVDRLCELRDKGDFSIKYCNCFIPPEIKICTEDFSLIQSFVKRVMARLKRLGVESVIFGSGYARAYPETMTKEQGMEIMEKFLLLCAEESEKNGIITSLEPLNATETNLFNTVCESAMTVRGINRKEIKLLPDCFHMCMEDEAPEVICENKDIIDHIHISEAPGRVFPGKYGGEYLKKAGKALAKGEYNGDITVECCFDDFEKEAETALRFVKEEML